MSESAHKALRLVLLVLAVGLAVVALWQFSFAPGVPAATPSMSVVSVAPTAAPTEAIGTDGAEQASEIGTCQVAELYIPELAPQEGEFNRWNVRQSRPEWQGDTPLPPRDARPGDPDPEGAFTDAFTLQWHDAGPRAADQVLIISHSSAWRKLPFNSLMVQGKKGIDASRLQHGAQIFLRTECSGTYWLQYQVYDVFTSDKPGFKHDPRVVGRDAMPGDLVLLTCLQPNEGPSTEVVGTRSRFVGVQKNL